MSGAVVVDPRDAWVDRMLRTACVGLALGVGPRGHLAGMSDGELVAALDLVVARHGVDGADGRREGVRVAYLWQDGVGGDPPDPLVLACVTIRTGWRVAEVVWSTGTTTLREAYLGVLVAALVKLRSWSAFGPGVAP